MIWIVTVSVLVSSVALLSLWGGLEDRRNLLTGCPTLETLISYTGISNRAIFIELLGDPDDRNRFQLPLSALSSLPKSAWHRFFDTPWTDAGCVALSAVAPFVWPGRPSLAIALLSTAAVIQAIGYSVAAVVYYRSGIFRELTGADKTADTNSPGP